MKRKIIRTVAALIAFIAVLVFVVYIIAWKSPEYYRTSTAYDPSDYHSFYQYLG